jgi:transcriptional regulator with XRE-family HTH domain
MALTSYKYRILFDLSNMSSMEKSEILKKVGKKIQEIRLNRGLTQVELVGKIEGEIDTTNISRIEAGRTNPTVYTLFRIAEALEVRLNDLLNID